MKLSIENTFTRELPADPIIENYRRQVKEACFSFVNPSPTSNPTIIHSNSPVQRLLGISPKMALSEDYKNVFTGNKILTDSKPYAMCYGGHQFGNWAGQLGDGRAINLGEICHENKKWAVQLKGAGATPYSRSADGLAVLRSSIREYLCSEAMHYLNIPTTRALSIGLSGDEVLRDMLYDGNPAYEPGAIVTRVAPSFLRFGNFEIFAARGDKKNLQKLVDYTIKHHFTHIKATGKAAYIDFFKTVSETTLSLIIHWQRVGFVHGVMNTDNLSILGLTIDYGPYGWLEPYDFGWTPNTTDAQNKRYRFGNQANIALWNLLQLANALYLLIEETTPLEAILESYKSNYEKQYLAMMLDKIGLNNTDHDNQQLINTLETNLHLTATDMTIFYRELAKIGKGDSSKKALHKVWIAFYKPSEVKDHIEKKWLNWFEAYLLKLRTNTISYSERQQKMKTTNPKYVLRNYMAQIAIENASQGDYSVIDELYQLLKNPYAEQTESEKWYQKRPEWANHKVGCAMLSCSS